MPLPLPRQLYALGTLSLFIYVFYPTLSQLVSSVNPFTLLLLGNEEQDEKMLMLRRRKKLGRYTVGLTNRANDCFANSNLQALASLQSLFVYLNEFNELIPSNDIELLSKALADMIRDMNEPILTPKSLSPWKILTVLERIYKSRISRSQHDAHELLHLVLETLDIEHDKLVKALPDNSTKKVPPFTFHGATVDRITCSKCGYSPPAAPSTFLVQSLMVPQKRSVHLNDLLTQLSTPEYIPDYGCTNCRLLAALRDPKLADLRSKLEPFAKSPATLPDELEESLPRITSPIAKSLTFEKLPDVFTVHLSRSIFGGYGASRNSCKVSFTEFIELMESPSHDSVDKDANGIPVSLLSKRKVKYQLVAMIRHKGTHQTGHYECFRRKNLNYWLSVAAGKSSSSGATTTNDGSAVLPTPRQSPSPPTSESSPGDSSSSSENTTASTVDTVPPTPPPKQELPYPGKSAPSPASLSASDITATNTSTKPQDGAATAALALSTNSPPGDPNVLPPSQYEWWKISDDKVWECHTRDVIKEESGVYLLFYEAIKA